MSDSTILLITIAQALLDIHTGKPGAEERLALAHNDVIARVHQAAEEYRAAQDHTLVSSPDGYRLVPSGHVQMPQDADEASAMVLLGTNWLETNAPERLRQKQTGIKAPTPVKPEPY